MGIPQGPTPSNPTGGWTPIPDPTTLTTEAVDRVTEQFKREISSLRELHDKDLEALRELVSSRIGNMDTDRTRLWSRAQELRQEFDDTLTRFRAEVERRDMAGRELIEQRLTDLDNARTVNARHIERIPDQITSRMNAEREYVLAQLEIVSTRTAERFKGVDEQFSASKIAVDAALSAAKEAVAEQNKANSAAIKVSEGNTKEQLTSLGQVSSANFSAMEDKISDARDRLTTIESLTRGIQLAGGEHRETGRDFRTGVMVIAVTISTIVGVAALIVTIALHG